MVSVALEYVSVGGNRHPGAADWDRLSGVLAYGADNNVALWIPTVSLLTYTKKVQNKNLA
jgi:elongator complex protein 2